jgi:hypothetical protein
MKFSSKCKHPRNFSLLRLCAVVKAFCNLLLTLIYNPSIRDSNLHLGSVDASAKTMPMPKQDEGKLERLCMYHFRLNLRYIPRPSPTLFILLRYSIEPIHLHNVSIRPQP